MSEQLIIRDNVQLCTEAFGQPSDPALLLIMGARASMIWWEDEFCRELADLGRYVIRYDHRDTGRSTHDEPGCPSYSLVDLADDAIHVLDAYGVASAHLAGMSLGGLLAQIIALRHPDRVRTLTLIATSAFAEGLPPMEQKIADFFAGLPHVDLSDAQTAVDFSVAGWDVLTGSKYPFDEARIRALSERDVQRTASYPSTSNHAMLSGGESYVQRVNEISQPALIVHGTEDPILPYAHGVALAETIPGAALLPLEGTGHELPPGDWPAVIAAIAAHTQGKQRSA